MKKKIEFQINTPGHGLVSAEYEDGVAFVGVVEMYDITGKNIHWMTSVELRELALQLEYAEKFYTEKEEQS